MPGFCVIGIQGGIDDQSPYILGNIFLKNFYMIYDMDQFKVSHSSPPTFNSQNRREIERMDIHSNSNYNSCNPNMWSHILYQEEETFLEECRQVDKSSEVQWL